jgi:hypothetical protein
MSLILLALALLAEAIATLIGFDWLIHADNYSGWLALGLAFYIAAGLAGPIRERRAG